jgi:hypothetical protein
MALCCELILSMLLGYVDFFNFFFDLLGREIKDFLARGTLRAIIRANVSALVTTNHNSFSIKNLKLFLI